MLQADEYQLVASMKEFYGDFYAVHDQLFHFDLPQITCVPCTEEG